MALTDIYTYCNNLATLRWFFGGFIESAVITQCCVSFLHGRCSRWCVLRFDLFDFLFEFVFSHIVHLAQLVELTQGQLGLAQVAQARLGVVC